MHSQLGRHGDLKGTLAVLDAQMQVIPHLSCYLMQRPSRELGDRLAAAKSKTKKYTVPEVWRTIVKKNERQGERLYDVLICKHAVPANDNTYRKARACPACRVRVQAYADGLCDGQSR